MPIISGSGGGAATVTAAAIEATFTSAGQIYQGTGAGSGVLQFPPGFEFGYDQITANVNLTGTTEGTATTCITCAPHTFDGSPVLVQVFTPLLRTDSTAASDQTIVGLFEGGALVNRIMAIQTPSAGASNGAGFFGGMRFTPSAAAHSYVVAGWVATTAGTPLFAAGAGGPGLNPPAFVRFTKV